MLKNKINNTRNILVVWRTKPLLLNIFLNILAAEPVPFFPIKNKYLFIFLTLSGCGAPPAALAAMTAFTNYKLAYTMIADWLQRRLSSSALQSSNLYMAEPLNYFFVLGSLCYVNIYLVFSILQIIKNMILSGCGAPPAALGAAAAARLSLNVKFDDSSKSKIPDNTYQQQQGQTNRPSLILNDNYNNNNNNKNNKPNNKDYWKYILLFILCFTITNILHFLGYNDITDLISVYKIGLIINLLFCHIIVYNSIAMYLVNYNPQRQIEEYKIYKYLPKSTKNFLSLYDTNHPELKKAMNKLLIGGIVISILIMVIINVVLLFI